MLDELLRPDVRAFIKEHRDADLHELVLRKDKYPDIPIGAVVDQIRGFKKAQVKLPYWSSVEGIVYPPLLSIEQCSSEKTAKYKFKDYQGGLAVDLTGGAGIDSFYLSKKFDRVIYVEQNTELARIATHNFAILGANNIEVVAKPAEEFLDGNREHFDFIFIDPSRRKDEERVFLWHDLTPDVVDLEQTLISSSKKVLIKGSPMVDIKQTLRILESVVSVSVVAVENDVKEVNFLLSGSQTDKILVRASNIKDNKIIESIFKLNDHYQEEINLGIVEKFLYEPNNSIMKSGAFNELAHQYDLTKLHRNTHLYTSEKLVNDFPGRKFRVLENIPYSKKGIKKSCPNNKANITTRNFPTTVEEIRKKTGIKDGGDLYIMAYTDVHDKTMIAVCEQLFTSS